MTALVQSLARWPIFSGPVDRLLLILIAIPLGVAVLDPDRLFDVLGIAASALAKTSIYILFAVGLLAWLRATGAERLVGRAFQGSPTRMIFLAAAVGGLAPFCSCEVIPFVASLLALGAPLAAVMAFWLSSPLMDPAQFAITSGALGVEYAVAKTAAALAIGVIGGFAVLAATRSGAFAAPLREAATGGCGCGVKKPFEGAPQWRFWEETERRGVFAETFQTQAWFLFRWMALAYLLEALLILYVPAEMIAGVVGGDGVQPIIVSALVGMPAYLNGAAAPALVSGLVEQGMQPGAALAFLIAGAVSSIPAMAAVWSLVKRPVFAAYLGMGVGGAITSGLIFQAII